MTTLDNETKIELKRAGTYFVNKAHVLATRLTRDLIERAIWKTTSSKIKPPNEKHLKRLIAASHGKLEGQSPSKPSRPPSTSLYPAAYPTRTSPPRTTPTTPTSTPPTTATPDGTPPPPLPPATLHHIITGLESRLHTHQWSVTLKTLLVLHRLLKEGSDPLHDALLHTPQLFNATKAKDVSDSGYGRRMERLVKHYFRYLEERTAVSREALRACAIPRPAGAPRVSAVVFSHTYRRLERPHYGEMLAMLEAPELVELTRRFLGQLEVMVGMEVDVTVLDNAVSVLVWRYVVQDARQVTGLVSDRLLFLIQTVFSVAEGKREGGEGESPEVLGDRKRKVYELACQYNVCVEGLNKTFRTLKGIAPCFHALPTLRVLPTESIQSALQSSKSAPSNETDSRKSAQAIHDLFSEISNSYHEEVISTTGVDKKPTSDLFSEKSTERSKSTSRGLENTVDALSSLLQESSVTGARPPSPPDMLDMGRTKTSQEIKYPMKTALQKQNEGLEKERGIGMTSSITPISRKVKNVPASATNLDDLFG